MSSPRLPVVLTDRLSAVGWHLAGARTEVVAGPAAADAFAAALGGASLVLLSREVAAQLPPAALAAARRRCDPPVLVIDESLAAPAGRAAARYARAVLGVGE